MRVMGEGRWWKKFGVAVPVSSTRLAELQSVMDDLIHSFISETVLNSASIPVLLADSLTQILRADRFAEEDLKDDRPHPPACGDQPADCPRPESGRRWILYDESDCPELLPRDPAVDHRGLPVGLFLIQCFPEVGTERLVGMAKETAHHGHAPVGVARVGQCCGARNVSEEVLGELGKDLDRLRTVTDRFSKIGSDPELGGGPRPVFTRETMAYLERRMPKAVDFTVVVPRSRCRWLSIPRCLDGFWRTLPRMRWTPWRAQGALGVRLSVEGARAQLDDRGHGKGMPRRVQRQVFRAGIQHERARLGPWPEPGAAHRSGVSRRPDCDPAERRRRRDHVPFVARGFRDVMSKFAVLLARMAELVDALDSNSSSNGVWFEPPGTNKKRHDFEAYHHHR